MQRTAHHKVAWKDVALFASLVLTPACQWLPWELSFCMTFDGKNTE